MGCSAVLDCSNPLSNFIAFNYAYDWVYGSFWVVKQRMLSLALALVVFCILKEPYIPEGLEKQQLENNIVQKHTPKTKSQEFESHHYIGLDKQNF